MIRLTFKQPYLSIKQLETVDLSDFALLTGLNGVGKTHLLHAIRDGKVEIQGIRPQEIVYFNYNDFVINPQIDHTQPEFKKNIQKVQQSKTNLYSIHYQQIKNIQRKIESDQDALDYALSTLILNPNYSEFETTIGNKEDFESLEKEIENLKTKTDLIKIKSSVSPNFYIFLSLFYSKSRALESLDYAQVEKKYQEINSRLSTELQNVNKDYYDFIFSNLNSNKSILSLTLNDFESINLFASEIAEEVKHYAILQCDNDHNEIRAKKWGENVAYLSKEKFLTKYGRHPLVILNEVLNEYDCNGYCFKESNFYPKPGQDLKNVVIPIQLIHREKGYETTLNQLSSGEQTLLAISLIIYKARKGNILPRILLLDEIDSALHPSMIERLLHVIETIFVKERKMKVIMVTHSPTTVALYPKQLVYIVENESKCQLLLRHKKEAIEFLTDGFATLEKGLKLFDQVSKKQISIITEGNNISYLKKANSFFGNQNIEIIDNLESCTGKNQLRTIFEFFARTNHDNKVIVVWDCDVKFKLNATNNSYPYIFDKNSINKKVKKGIENLFPEKVFKDEFYSSQTKDDGGYHMSLNKKPFEEHMMKNGTMKDFENFKTFFDWIKKEIE